MKTTVPQDATAFSISDSLVPVLEFAGEDAEASLTLNGEKLDAKQIKLKDQTISAELTEEQVKANGGKEVVLNFKAKIRDCLLYTSPSPRDQRGSRMPSSA